MLLSRGTGVQTEGTVCAKALRQELAGAESPRRRVVEMKPIFPSALEPNSVCQEPVGKLRTLPVPLRFKVQGPGGHGEPLQRLHQRHCGTLKARCATIS